MAPPNVVLDKVGIRFTVRRHSRLGLKPKLVRARQTFWGIKDVSLEINPGEVVGIIGSNGSGKTTLLRTIGGIYRPDSGAISVRGIVGSLLSASGGFRPELSGRENAGLTAILMGLPPKTAADIVEAVGDLAQLGDLFDAEVRVYSSGMKARLGFAIAARVDPNIVLLDEVITFSDQDFRRTVEQIVLGFASEGKSVLLSSHEIDDLAHVCGRMIHLEEGRVVHDGPSAEVARAYRHR